MNTSPAISKLRRGTAKKPHIYWVGPWSAVNRRWICTGQGIVAAGHSPQWAYACWADDLARSITKEKLT